MFEIGTSLKEARLRRRIDFADAEDDTKIRSKYLQAMESEDFAVLPGPVFAKGFLRTYAAYLGLDGQLYVDEYNSRFSRFEEDEQALASSLVVEQRRFRWIPTLRLVAITGLVVLALVSWLGLRAPGSTVEQVSVNELSWTELTQDVSAQLATVNQAAVEQARAQEAPTVPAFAVLKLRATDGEVWASVRRASRRGPVVFEGTIRAGAARTFRAQKLYVTLGYPANASMQVGSSKLDPVATDATLFEVTPEQIRPLPQG